MPKKPDATAARLLVLVRKALRQTSEPRALRKALQSVLAVSQEEPIEKWLDLLLEREDSEPALLPFALYQLMQAANMRGMHYCDDDGVVAGTALALVGLIPLNVQIQKGASPRAIIAEFLGRKLQESLIRHKALGLGLVAPGDGLFFVPLLIRTSLWPQAWTKQYALTEELLSYVFKNGEALLEVEDLPPPPETESLLEEDQILELVLPFVLLAPQQPRSPLLQLVMEGEEQTPEAMALWEELAAVWERGLIEIPGVAQASCLAPGLQAEALDRLEAEINHSQLRTVLAKLRAEAPRRPVQVFVRAVLRDQGFSGEWRILLQAGTSVRGVVWKWLGHWEDTEDELVDLLHEEGVSSGLIHLDEDVGTLHEILNCPECGAPYFFRNKELLRTCGHPLPEKSRSWH